MEFWRILTSTRGVPNEQNLIVLPPWHAGISEPFFFKFQPSQLSGFLSPFLSALNAKLEVRLKARH